jgi:outer membrane lipoprotein-sorting protein
MKFRLLMTFFCCLLLSAACGSVVAANDESIDPALMAVLERFDRVQNGIQTLSADFTWTTESVLLKDPVVSEGIFYMTKPKAVRWEFTSPEPMEFVIAHDQYIGYFPERKKAEKRNFKRWSARVFRYFGLGQGSQELSKVYRIRLGDAGECGDLAEVADLLILEPKKRRARKKIKDLRIWVAKESSLPVRVITSDPAGGRRLIEFRNTQVNPTFASNLYEVQLPSDVTITEGFSGLGGDAENTEVAVERQGS